MPVINPNYVPSVPPGSLFSTLTTDDSLGIRWLTNRDPVFYSVFNRPHADITVRQLVIAKAVDQLSSGLGHLTLFPFLFQPRIAGGSSDIDLPIGMIWDVSISVPVKWEMLRLAKIKRISGSNDSTAGSTGKLRLIFTATTVGSTIETAILQADYNIASTLTYQIVKLTSVSTDEEAVHIDAGESETVTGTIIFKTLDVADDQVITLLDVLAPPSNQTTGTDGLYVNPAIYELLDAIPTDTAGDVSTTSISHGTGLLESSAYNLIPPLDSDIQSWVNAFNYPFGASANLTSVDGITMPSGLFKEFDITVPAGDEPTGDTSGTYFPVWVSRVERIGSTSNQLRFHFATHNVTDAATGGTPSTEAIEFATLDLTRDMSNDEVVDIVPADNLQLREGSDASLWGQHLGRGHVVLSSLWDGTSEDVSNFFDAFALISDSPADTTFSKSSTRIASFGLSRVPKYVPTIGQAQALLGSTARRTSPSYPSNDNRYVTEADQGSGDSVDLESQSGITPNTAIERTAYKGALVHRVAKLVINAPLITGDRQVFYDTQILPRLRILFGRDPVFGDMYHNGTRVMFFNGNTWQSLG